MVTDHKPDFSNIDRSKAQQMFHEGHLEELYLMPLEFGGQDFSANVLYVPKGIAAIKSSIDSKIIRPLLEKGTVSQYAAVPEYHGNSFVPARLRIRAFNADNNNDDFTTEIDIWGPHLRSAFAEAHSFETPEKTVLAYIGAHCRWENQSREGDEKLGWVAGAIIAQHEYERLISHFCASSVRPQPLSYGEPTMHDPILETIESVSVSGGTANVITKRINTETKVNSDYEYHLVSDSDGWRISSVLYVSDDGKFECL
jgi:hypothetical protein